MYYVQKYLQIWPRGLIIFKKNYWDWNKYETKKNVLGANKCYAAEL